MFRLQRQIPYSNLHVRSQSSVSDLLSYTDRRSGDLGFLIFVRETPAKSLKQPCVTSETNPMQHASPKNDLMNYARTHRSLTLSTKPAQNLVLRIHKADVHEHSMRNAGNVSSFGRRNSAQSLRGLSAKSINNEAVF
jgi:hypothetical protein